ncbi:MAG TPA: phage/plasmid primase, P4 family [Gordonia sp. (in: high G+C Gram-positive bacteria)]|uniref:DNA primase family protein n=2 Tax=unclassified Gordonia (in: high G+C Gram-positive bacteria) TaxID=2657482 RepID=UPI002B5C5A58|nr:phage/plasmid primase, P4 family [Gordonia sp. (in: high G+C Gram-positive bacteria)]HRC52542.1 phage/plasmid primase, P4 family [Gordonia sp. (in: high G+C Gram-positive bacteria)]
MASPEAPGPGTTREPGYGAPIGLLRAHAAGWIAAQIRTLPRERRPAPPAIRAMIVGEINRQFAMQIERIKSGEILGPFPPKTGTKDLIPTDLAPLLQELHGVVAIVPDTRAAGSAGQGKRADGEPLVAYYDDDPASDTYGLHVTQESKLHALASSYFPLSDKAFSELMGVLRSSSPRRTYAPDANLIPCRNGVVEYNCGNPTFREFSPEHVFLGKLEVAWNPDAENVEIEMPDGEIWDVESWMASLDDDPEVVDLLWKCVGAVARPYTSWRKALLPFSVKGNNGKGTLVRLMRNLVGASAASIPIADFGREFRLEPLLSSTAILVDENPVGTFIEDSANFKAVITNDVILVNRKNRPVVSHQHFGFMVQCLNEEPVFRDKSPSLLRRFILLPFTKCFTGIERPYIKEDYLGRPEVLEYVLKRVLTMDYDELPEPRKCREALARFRESNDSVLAFWNEVKNDLTWDLVPRQFMCDLFRGWCKKNMPTQERQMASGKFWQALVNVIDTDPDSPFMVARKPDSDDLREMRPSGAMTEPELLIYLYDLVDWSNPQVPKAKVDAENTQFGYEKERTKHCTFPLYRQAKKYRGLVRRPGWSQAEIADRQRAAVLAEIDARGTERPNPAEVVDQDGPQAESEPAYQAPATPAAPAAPAAPVAVNPDDPFAGSPLPSMGAEGGASWRAWSPTEPATPAASQTPEPAYEPDFEDPFAGSPLPSMGAEGGAS